MKSAEQQRLVAVKEPVVGMRVYADRLERWGTITDLGSRSVWLRWDAPLYGVWESNMRWDRLLTTRGDA